jgi:hydrogenase maturation protease
VAFDFPQGETREPLLTPDGRVAGLSIVRGETVRGQVRLQAEPIGRGCWRATVRVENLTPWDRTAKGQRELAQASALLSTHCILGTRGGELISLLDPPDELREAALECDNLGTFPVLVGPQGSRDTMLSSAIILYDYPAIAPESPGDLFDGTEIDEILSLRILALTDSEKAEIAAGDPRGAELLRRTESLGPQGMGRLHGALRRPDRSPAGEPGEWPAADPASGSRAGPAPGSALAVGDRVRLRPRAGAGGDIMDLVLDGRTAVVEAIERDLEDRVHLALTLEDDPARGLDLGPLPGHRFYFGPEEIERLRREGGA